jgi:drug/metabolite transporter (DMT)-like permease
MHRTSGQWQLGVSLSIITAIFWGLLPIALKALLTSLDAVTVTWFRFVFSALCVGIYLGLKTKSHQQKRLNLNLFSLLMIAILGLIANYLCYLIGLEKTTPSTAQIVIQLAPILLLLGGLIFFKESFSKRQCFGLLLFLMGLGLFFNQRVDELLRASSQYTQGIVYVVIAALTWAAYALAQKQLLKNFKSTEIMLLIYIAGSFIFLPYSQPTAILKLDNLGWGLLLFFSINTTIAYGSFAEALDHLEASRVSAILAITPLLTILFMHIIARLAPEFVTLEPLNQLSALGALIMVLGSIMTALSKRGI